MINHLIGVIKQIKQLLDAHELLDTTTVRSLAAEYSKCCVEFNTMASELNANVEAMQQDGINAKLEEIRMAKRQFELINREQFELVYRIYSWPPPPPLLFALIDTIETGVAKVDLQRPLLDRYRVAAQSGNVMEVVHILRQLVKHDPQRTEWRQALTEHENQLFRSLSANAKAAILKKDPTALAEILTELAPENWHIKLDQRVENKVRKTLEDLNWHAAETESLTLLERIAATYSAFDVDGLSTAMTQWQEFLERTGFSPDVSATAQVDEAAEYLTKSLRRREEEKEFNHMLERLSAAIDNNTNILDVTRLYEKIERYDFKIPENIKRQYRYYLASQEEIAKRKRIARYSIATVSVLLVIGVGYWGIDTLRENRLVSRWHDQLEQSLQNDAPIVTLQLADQLRRDCPRIMSRPEIAGLISNIDVLRKEHEANTVRFGSLAETITRNLDDLEATSKQVAADLLELKSLADSPEATAKYGELYDNYAGKLEAIKEKSDQHYKTALDHARELNSELNEALSGDDFDRCAAIIVEYKKRMADANRIANISDGAVAAGQELLRELEEKERMCQARQQYRDAVPVFIQALKSADNISTMEKTLDDFIAIYPDELESINLGYSKSDEISRAKEVAKLHLPDMQSEIPADSPLPGAIIADYAQYRNNIAFAAKLRSNALNNLQTMLKKEDINAVILKRDNVVYEYYFRDYVPGAMRGGMYYFSMNCIISGAGETTPVALKLAGEAESSRAIVSDDRYGEWSGSLLYPKAASNELPIAPHVLAIKAILTKLEAGDSDAETAIIASIDEVAKSELINPSLKLAWFETLLAQFPQDYPAASVWRKPLAELVASIKSEVPSNYNWWCSYDPAFQKTYKTLLRRIKEIDVAHYRGVADMENKILKTGLERNLRPVGFLISIGGSAYEFNAFSSVAPESCGELWIYKKAADEFLVVGYNGKLNGNLEKSAKFAEKQPPLLIVYAPGDNRQTQTLRQQLTIEAKAIGIDNINWPKSWPKSLE